MAHASRQRRHVRRRSRYVVTERIRGGLRGFLSAIESFMDPDVPEPEEDRFRPSQHGSDRRARMAERSQREKAAKRSPF